MRALIVFLPILAVACAPEAAPSSRQSVTPPAASDAGNADADTRAAAPVADPNDGREENPSACYAACANTAFTCGDLAANVAFEQSGCSGTIGTSTLKLDCGKEMVCVDGTCVTATFSAFSFAYTPAGSAKVICMRD